MEPDLQQILMEQMRDIHLPAEVSWWPLAPGWWILLCLFLAAAAFAIWALVQNHTQNRYRHQAITALNTVYAQWTESQNAAAYVQAANAVLKRALASASNSSARPSLSLSGSAWINLLNQYGKTSLSEQAANALAQAGYQIDPQIDIENLHRELGDWLKTHRKQPLAQPKVSGDAAHA